MHAEHENGARSGSTTTGAAQIFLLSAPDETALVRTLRELHDRASAETPLHLLAVRKAHVELQHCRVALVAESPKELRDKLAQALAMLSLPQADRRSLPGWFLGFGERRGKLAFLFPGQGSQFRGMLSELSVHYASVRRWVEALDAAYLALGRQKPSEALGDENVQALHDMPIGAQLGLTASVAISELLTVAGVVPDCLVGHSNGERAALLVGGGLGAIEPASACAEFAQVGVLAESMRTDPEGEGLLAVMAGRKGAVEIVLARYPGELFLAISNSPVQVVFGGRCGALEQAAAELKHSMALCSRLPFERAFHTPLVLDWTSALRRHLDSVAFHKLRIPVYSTLTTAPFPENADEIRDCMARQWSSTVRFRETVEQLYQDGVRLFVEVGPDAKLSALVGDILRGRSHLAVSASSAGRAERAQLLQVLAALFAAGIPLNPEALEGGPQAQVSRPEGQRSRESAGAVSVRSEHRRTMERIAEAESTILQRMGWTHGGMATGQVVRRTASEQVLRLRLTEQEAHPYLSDHALGTSCLGGRQLQVLPFTFTLALAVEVARRHRHMPISRLRNLKAHRWLALDGGVLDLEIAVSTDQVRVYALQDGASHLAFQAGLDPSPPGAAAATVQSRPTQWSAPACRPETFYRDQVFHGPAFHCIKSFGISAQHIKADIAAQTSAAEGWDADPALLDCAGQLVAYWMLENGWKDFGVFPVSMDAFEVGIAAPRPQGQMRVRGEVAVGALGLTTATFEFVHPRSGVVWRLVNFRQKIVHFPAGIRPWLFGKSSSRSLFNGGAEGVSPEEWSAFLQSGQGIWSRVLAHGLLDARELASLYRIPASERQPRMIAALESAGIRVPASAVGVAV